MDFNSLDKLCEAIQDDIDKVLKDEVAESVKDVMQEEIQAQVYDKYNPTYYVRRYDNGGLICRDNLKSNAKAGILTVLNDTPLNEEYGSNDSKKSLAEIIISGDGYKYNNFGEYSEPRDFISSTQDKINSGIGKDALVNGLKNRGWTVK